MKIIKQIITTLVLAGIGHFTGSLVIEVACGFGLMVYLIKE